MIVVKVPKQRALAYVARWQVLAIAAIVSLLGTPASASPSPISASHPAGLPAAAFDSAVVTANQYDQTLRHNIPDLRVTRGGRVLDAGFLDHYRRTGGLTRWGLPTSEVFEEEEGNLVQYYQRGVVDWHVRPDLGGAYVIERRLAWDYFGGGLGGSTDLGTENGRPANPNPGMQLGPWGHRVSNVSVNGVNTGFLDFFRTLGGVESFGFPKSEARPDVDPPATNTLHIPGATPGFIRQYFQAAVVEYHPGDPAPVKLRLLGDDLRDKVYAGEAWRRWQSFSPAVEATVGGPYTIERVMTNGGAGGSGSSGGNVGDVGRCSMLTSGNERGCLLDIFLPEITGPGPVERRIREVAELTGLPLGVVQEVLVSAMTPQAKAQRLADLTLQRLRDPAARDAAIAASTAAMQRARAATQEAARKGQEAATAIQAAPIDATQKAQLTAAVTTAVQQSQTAASAINAMASAPSDATAMAPIRSALTAQTNALVATQQAQGATIGTVLGTQASVAPVRDALEAQRAAVAAAQDAQAATADAARKAIVAQVARLVR
jgi:hypothetical protein